MLSELYGSPLCCCVGGWGLHRCSCIGSEPSCAHKQTHRYGALNFTRPSFLSPSCVQSWWVKALCPFSRLKRWRASAFLRPLPTTLWSFSWRFCVLSRPGLTGPPMRGWLMGRSAIDHGATVILTHRWPPSTRGWDTRHVTFCGGDVSDEACYILLVV